jgi:predicted ArsR family transcriptional regulator
MPGLEVRMRTSKDVVEDSLLDYGPGTVAQLAARLNISPQSAGNHLRTLRKQGRVDAEEVEGRGAGVALRYRSLLVRVDP